MQKDMSMICHFFWTTIHKRCRQQWCYSCCSTAHPGRCCPSAISRVSSNPLCDGPWRLAQSSLTVDQCHVALTARVSLSLSPTISLSPPASHSRCLSSTPSHSLLLPLSSSVDMILIWMPEFDPCCQLRTSRSVAQQIAADLRRWLLNLQVRTHSPSPAS